MFRSAFSEWYSPDEQTVADIISNGTIALDTNVLLSLYRISAVARQDLLTLLGNDRIRPRLFIPYQVGLEYHRRRVSVALDQNVGYRSLETRIEKVRSTLLELAVKEGDNDIRDNQVRQELNAAADIAVEASNSALDELVSKVERIRQTHMIADTQLAGADPVRDALEELFANDGQVGTKPKEGELSTRQKEATKRYAAKIPPGYEDAVGKNAKDDPSGDYLIWRELLDRATSNLGPIMFVTDDKKPDWYAKDKQGRILGPRAELRAEMATVTTHPYHQTPMNSFLHLVEKHLDLALSKDTVDQVKEASNRRNFLAWNSTEAPLANSHWTVPMTLENLSRAQRIILETSDAAADPQIRKWVANHAKTPAARHRQALQLAREILEVEPDEQQLSNDLATEQAWEEYSAVREPEEDLDTNEHD